MGSLSAGPGPGTVLYEKQQQEKQQPKAGNIQYPFWFGGTASSAAACITHPLDLNAPKGIVATCARIIQRDGVLGFYSGISASLVRQLTYSGVRFGLYEEMKQRAGSKASFPTLIAAASCSGFAGGIMGNFADVLNVRMQSDAALPGHRRRNYKHVVDGLIRMTREERVSSWFKGWLPNSSRAAVQTAGQLASYDFLKGVLMEWTSAKDTLSIQISAASLAGLVAATVTNPIDVVKTRVMAPDGPGGESVTGVLRHAFRTEGLSWMVKGWVPSFLRIGP